MNGLSYPDPPLSDGAIRLRPWTLHDLSAVEQAGHDPYVPATTTVPASYSEEAGRAWIERQWQRLSDGLGIVLCIADAPTDEPLGMIALWVRDMAQGRASFGYWVVPRARGRGAATTAVRLLGTWAFVTLNVARLEILVEPDNAASQRVAERAGFQREGLLRAYKEFHGRRLDLIMFARLPRDEPNRNGAC